MKLIKCNVFAFGKLKNFDYDFNSGLNTISHDNGWGKSTFATFIKAMFYGLNDKRRNLADNERIKYRPWNSTEKFGGFIIFEWKDKQYKIERFFGLKESEDSVTITDVETGKTFADTKDLGKRIFQIDEDGFLSTTYFSQKEFEIKSNTSITAKFNEVYDVQDTALFDKACEKLNEKAKEYKVRGGKGKIADVTEEIYKTEQKIESAKLSKETLEKLQAELSALIKEQERKSAENKQLSEKLIQLGKIDAIKLKKNDYTTLVERKNLLDSKLKENMSLINGNDVKPETLSTVKSSIEAYNKDCLALENLSKDIQSLEKDFKPTKAINPKIKKGIFLGSIAGMLIGVVLALALSIPYFYGLSAISLLAFFYVLSKNDKPNASEMLIQSRKQEIEQISTRMNKTKSYLDNFFGGFKVEPIVDYSNAFESVMDVVKESTVLLEQIKELNEKISVLEKDADVFAEVVQLDESESELRQKYNQNEQIITGYSRQIAEKNTVIKRHEEILDETVFLNEKKQELNEKLLEYNENYSILTQTVKFLEQADNNLKTKYKQPLQQSLNKYIEKTFGKDFGVNIDIDLNIKAVGAGAERDTEYFSKGNQNLFEICKRFALTDVLFTGEKPFIILDDPFYNLDETKLASTKELVVKLSEEYQIIYLVCHESRVV